MPSLRRAVAYDVCVPVRQLPADGPEDMMVTFRSQLYVMRPVSEDTMAVINAEAAAEGAV
jgi:hypothetical protein